MGFLSQISVFNATFTIEDKKKAEVNKQNVENWKQNFVKDEQYLIRTKPVLAEKKARVEQLKKAGQDFSVAETSYKRLYTDRVLCRNQLKSAIKTFKEWGIKVESTELKDD
jgi:muramoyltetrapeptide carboxypeptidase LdcA involved in peptidoglycan recycling